MNDLDHKPRLKGLLWSEIQNGSYWVVPVHDKVVCASDYPEVARILEVDGDRWIDFEGRFQPFDDYWKAFVFFPCDRPRMADIDVSAGLTALEGLSGS